MNFDSEFENNSNGDGPNDIGINDNKTAQSDKKKSSFLRKDSSKYTDKILKRGVIYISRIPPFMKPNRARSLFEQYGEVTRIYLAEEDSGKRKLRKSNGGNGSKHFTEGWVEYADKSTARSVAESLNNKPIGITKGDYYHDDIWNLKYLKGFKWDYLTEKIAYERRVREQKLRVAMTQVNETIRINSFEYLICFDAECVLINYRRKKTMPNSWNCWRRAKSRNMFKRGKRSEI